MSDNRMLEGKTILLMGVANPWSIAYAIGQLEPDLFEMTEWWTAKGDTGRGLVLFSRGGRVRVVGCAGLRACAASAGLRRALVMRR